MRRRLSRIGKLMMQHRYGFTLFVYLSAAAVGHVGPLMRQPPPHGRIEPQFVRIEDGEGRNGLSVQ